MQTAILGTGVHQVYTKLHHVVHASMLIQFLPKNCFDIKNTKTLCRIREVTGNLILLITVVYALEVVHK